MKSAGNPKDLYILYSGKKPFSIWDIAVIIVLICIIATSIFFIACGSQGSYAEIYYNGELIKTVSLADNNEFTLDDVAGSPTFSIVDGAIAILHVDCPNQICVHTDYISRDNERIVCLPNKITVVVRSNDDDSYVVTGGVSYG